MEYQDLINDTNSVLNPEQKKDVSLELIKQMDFYDSQISEKLNQTKWT